MATRTLHRLTIADVKAARTPGKMYADGGGLRLTVRANGHRTWEFRYMRNRRGREMSLGDADYITLAEARQRAHEARDKLAHGIDPLDERQEARAASKPADVPTFQKVAEEYITLHGPAWKSAVHREQWIATLKAYAYPKMGDEPIATVSKQHILKALEPIWTSYPRNRVAGARAHRNRSRVRHSKGSARGAEPRCVARQSAIRAALTAKASSGGPSCGARLA